MACSCRARRFGNSSRTVPSGCMTSGYCSSSATTQITSGRCVFADAVKVAVCAATAGELGRAAIASGKAAVMVATMASGRPIVMRRARIAMPQPSTVPIADATTGSRRGASWPRMLQAPRLATSAVAMVVMRSKARAPARAAAVRTSHQPSHIRIAAARSMTNPATTVVPCAVKNSTFGARALAAGLAKASIAIPVIQAAESAGERLLRAPMRSRQLLITPAGRSPRRRRGSGSCVRQPARRGNDAAEPPGVRRGRTHRSNSGSG